EERRRAPKDQVLLLEHLHLALELAEFLLLGLGLTRLGAGLDPVQLEPTMQTRLGDPKIGSDLRLRFRRRLGRRDHHLTELVRKRLGHDNILSREAPAPQPRCRPNSAQTLSTSCLRLFSRAICSS